MNALRPRQLPDALLAEGISTFTTEEAQGRLGLSYERAKRALNRLAQSGRVFSPARGFYVVIPPEYRSWQVVPAAHFIDPMMAKLGRTYYVALLSAAALHGASHQAPQVFQVMCDLPLRDRDFHRVRLRFFSGAHVADAPTITRNVSTGTIRVATPELTVVDLAQIPRHSGGLSNVATILREIGRLDGRALAQIIAGRDRSVARRIGWMVEHFGQCENLAPLRELATPHQGERTLLSAGGRKRGRADREWGIRVNTDIEPDV
jgi:predicted transcriptional regulator of viral defense system